MNQVFTFNEALEASKIYFDGDELAAKVWVNKYALKDSNGNIYEKTPTDMHWRLAREIARIEKNYPNPMSEEELFELFDRFKYIVPQGGPMTGIGNPYQISSLSNCFVCQLEESNADSYGSIMKVDEELIQLEKRRGGVGHDLSHLRPAMAPVSNAAMSSSGVSSFMERYSNSTREVSQNSRRGALMLSLSINHPDADKFIDAKMEEGKVTGANISVKIDDNFMNAVLEDEVYIQNFPIYSPNPSITKEIKAKELWKKIIHNAWKSAEPGILFWDTIIRESVPDCYSEFGFKTVSTNPCGEIPLCPYDSCRLIALNLYSYVTNPFTDHAGFDIDLLEKHTRLALRIMDDIIDLEIEKIDQIIEKVKSDPESEEVKHTELRLWEKIREKCLMGRRTGVGITAEGDMLAALGYRYGTEASIDFSENIHKIIALNVYKSSVNLARERGVFPVYDSELEKNNPFINRLKEADPEFGEALEKYGRRNIACLTIAPTGTVSLMTQTSSGIEPVFLAIYKRRRKINPTDTCSKVDFVDENGDSFEEFLVIHPKFKVWMEMNDIHMESNASQEEIDSLVKLSPYYKSTSNDIDWLQKVKMQGRIQKWVDHSISVTINLPKDVSEELVNELYIEAWRSGCKGCTVYRDGSRSGVLVSTNTKDEQKKSQENTKRPKRLKAEVVRFKHNSQNWIAFVGILNNRPYEIFTGIADEDNGILLPKSIKNGEIEKYKDEDGNKHYRFSFVNKAGIGGSIDNLENRFSPEFWNYAKLISATLRYEMPIHKVVSLIQSLEWNSESINNWRNGVIRALKGYIQDGTKAK
ncbi:adenosylcobalamin-dependent ribonucleoside-diphosphate reductase, partial [Parabacteroides distasonis]